MPALQVKDFPADLYEELRACAAAEDRSITQQTVRILREYLRAYRQVGGQVDWQIVPVGRARLHAEPRAAAADERQQRIERKRKAFERIEALPPFDVPDGFPSPAELVRQARDERDEWMVGGLEGDR